MHLIPRKPLRSFRPIAVAFMLALLISAPAVNAADAIRLDQPANEILTQLQLIQGDAKAGKRGWDNISAEKKTELTSVQERIIALLEGKRSAADLQESERVDLATALERVNTLATEAEDERKVCTRERVVGSNFPITTCTSVAEKRRQREASQEAVRRSAR